MTETTVIGVAHVAASPTYRLLLTFENGETRVLNMSKLVESEPFAVLKPIFMQVYVEGGDIYWHGTNHEIATRFFYDKSTPC